MRQHRVVRWSRSRPLRALVVMAVVAAGTVAGATAAVAAGGITVTPNTALVDGQTVTIAGSGWTPGAQLAYCEGGNPNASGADGSSCASGAYTLVTADLSGDFTATFAVARSIFVPSLDAQVDCEAPTAGCWIGAADITDVAGTGVRETITFAPACPALTAEPHTSFTLSDGNLVGSVATFVADPDHVLVGSSTLTCEPSQTWSDSPPTALFTGTPVLTPGTGAVDEGNSGTTELDVPVTLSEAISSTVTAHWQTVFVSGAPAGQADPATDYVPASGTVTLAPGETQATVPILVKGDTLVETEEFIVVQFDSPVNATLGASDVGYGRIIDDDREVVTPGAASVVEGNSGTTVVDVPVTLSNVSSLTTTAQWATVFVPGAPAGQADPATDYVAAGGTVTFAPGVTAATVPITVNGDTTVEPDEYIVVLFGNVTNGLIGGFWGLGFGVITNDD